MSILITESPAIPEIQAREVVRCGRCSLVQFRTVSDLCRRCDGPLPARPRPDLAVGGSSSEALDGVAARARSPHHPDGHSRRKTARELTIGRKLRELREQQHLTQQEMAVKAGVPRTYISRIENARLLPGPVMLRRIAEALQVEILDLLPKKRLNAAPLPGAGEDDPLWTSLAGYFSQLQPHEMSLVMGHVRAVIGERSAPEFLPHPAILATV